MAVPDVHYARSGDVSIAYQVVGTDPSTSSGSAGWRGKRPGEVLVSSAVRDLVAGSGIEFEDSGAHELRGVPGEWRLYSVVSA